ncbi:m-AAA protease-interacting protein 1, mitochondrial-like [Haliotis rufescens]|uniref:m-AAA protease-interacting protein 1, mitochondrial-like n=1 Tax=Haliotis rufescens TaxID=6454 RepID=UPI001EAFD54E|nr:m-AAA protease-interacting protein 1, mitochondrial-like [Haliotis rufescens]
MALRSIWALGAIIYSNIRPRVLTKLSKLGLRTFPLTHSPNLSRVLLCQTSKSSRQNFPQLSTLAFTKHEDGLGSKICASNVPVSKVDQRQNTRSFSTGIDESGKKRRIPLKLMEFPEILWPNIIKSMKNRIFAFLITGYFDKSFTIDSFIDGCIQAVSLVSSCISVGNFDSLQGLVEDEAIQEIRNSYADLDVGQRRFICVNPRDIFFRFVYEIGMIFDDHSERRFVEVTVVLQGFHGYNEAKEKEPVEYYNEVRDNQERLYICNYRFIREFTKGMEGDWSINKLNHFSPKEFTMI